MTQAYLSLELVDKSFQRGSATTDVLRQVSMKVQRGEYISIIGHSGCGKSTLLNIVAGLTRATSGAVILDGTAVEEPGPDRAVVALPRWKLLSTNATRALLMAVQEAQMWCETAGNKEELAEIVGRRAWFNVPVKDINRRLKGEFNYGTGRTEINSPHFMKFWRDHASYPFQSHDLWFLTENIRWGKFEPGLDTKGLIAKVNREDIWREAAKQLGLPESEIPASPSRGKETFFDGKIFDPDKPADYLASLAIKRMEA